MKKDIKYFSSLLDYSHYSDYPNHSRMNLLLWLTFVSKNSADKKFKIV